MPTDERPKAEDEQADWVMSFVDHSQKEMLDDMEPIWEEIEQNFLVRPREFAETSRSTAFPLGPVGFGTLNRTPLGEMSILKDPETHQEVMQIVSGVVLSLMPEGDPFIKTRHIGNEDLYRARTSAALIEYDLRLEGAYSSMCDWILGAGIHGTGLLEAFWDYVEEPVNAVSITADPLTGDEFKEVSIVNDVPVWDDVRLEAFHVRDFFPDPSATTTGRMCGAARRGRVTSYLAERRGEQGVWNKSRVDRALSSPAAKEASEGTQDSSLLDSRKPSHPDFKEMIFYRYVGHVPFRVKDGFQKREIVVLNGTTVRSRPWGRRLPWFECKLSSRLGSFYGISPGELIRFDQDFADVIKRMLADAIVRMVHPPILYDTNRKPDLAKLRRWAPKVPVGCMGDPASAVSIPNYNPNVQAAFAMQAGLKQQMREATSATDVVQGLGLGTKRASATEFAGTATRAEVRPEFFNGYMERTWLPPLGKYMLKLNQEFLQSTEDLRMRVGASNATSVLSDINADFDVEFVGSRNSMSRQEEISAFREIMASAANPVVLQLSPWISILQRFYRKLGLDDIADQVGNPELVQMNVMLNRLTSAKPSIGSQPSDNQAPSSALPAQIAGGLA